MPSRIASGALSCGAASYNLWASGERERKEEIKRTFHPHPFLTVLALASCALLLSENFTLFFWNLKGTEPWCVLLTSWPFCLGTLIMSS